MPEDSSRSSRSQLARCRSCGEEFLSYGPLTATQCPRCGRPARTASQRRVLRLRVMAVLFGVLIAGGLVYWLMR